MESTQLKERLIGKSIELGIDKIGFASSDPFVELRERLREQQARGFQSGFEEPDIERRVEVNHSLPGAKSIIAIALAYPAKLEEPPESRPGANRGLFCRASWGTDYHVVLTEKLKLLQTFLQQLQPHARCQSMVDTGSLSDRAVAVRAGLGWSGKNTALITPEFGSWVYLGEMITDVYLPPDEPILDSCGDCDICMQACPTGALVQPGQLDAQSCLAYLTQTRGMLPERFRTKIGNRLYGCDTCQVVCPKNQHVNFTHQPELQPEPELVKPLLQPLLKMNKRTFREKYGHMAGSWRGHKPIQRNALLALAHFKDEAAVPDVIHCLHHDPRPVIRATAAYALGQIGGELACEALQQALKMEQDEGVRKECRAAISPRHPPSGALLPRPPVKGGRFKG